jgi:uncharacterized protein YoxC
MTSVPPAPVPPLFDPAAVPPSPASDTTEVFEAPHPDPLGEPPTMPTPTVEAPVIAPASSVVLSRDSAPKERRTRSIVPWAIAAVLGLAAIAFAVLWVGESSDADDLSKTNDSLTAENATLTSDLAATNEELTAAQADLAAAKADLESANATTDDLSSQVDDLSSQVADLQQQVDDLEAAAGDHQISDAVALGLGQSFGEGADPAFTDAEATCMGHAIYDIVGVETLLEFSVTANPTPEQLAQLIIDLSAAADQCSIDLNRLPT